MVRFHYDNIPPIALPNKRNVQQFIGDIFLKEKKQLNQLDYVFCNDEKILDINRRFLDHDYYTDIITFDLSHDKQTVGEIYISIDTVRSNADLFKAIFKDELLRVIFHGALHLCGYKDKTKSEITLMRQKEDYYLRLYHQKS